MWGSRRPSKRRLLSPPKTKVKDVKTIKTEELEVKAVGNGIVVDVGPGDDDEFVKTLVQVQKTQICINSRNAIRTTRSSMTSRRGNVKHDRDIPEMIPLTVQIPSVEYLLEKYGRHFALNYPPDLESESASPSPTRSAKRKSLTMSTPSLPPVELLPKSVKLEALSLPEAVAEDVDLESAVKNKHKKLTPRSISNEVTTSNKKKKKRTGYEKRKRTKPKPLCIPATDDVVHDISISDNVVIPSEPDPDPPSSCAFPKRVSLKKALIEEMLKRVAKPDRSSIIPAPEENQLTEQEFVSPTSTVPPIQTIDLSDDDDSISFVPPPKSLIIKEEIDLEDELVVPRIDTVSSAADLIPPAPPAPGQLSDSDRDIGASSDDDTLADPDFDPSVVDLQAFERSDQWKNKKGSPRSATKVPCTTSSTTCLTCSIRFLTRLGLKTHMKECHNDYETEDIGTPEPLRLPGQYNCSKCQLPFGSALGLKVHVARQHPKIKRARKAAPAAAPKVEVVLAGEPQPPAEFLPKVLYVCSFPDCDRQFSSILNTNIHKALDHECKPKKSIACFLCSAVAVDPPSLLQHLKINHGGKVDEEGYAEFSRHGYTLPNTESQKQIQTPELTSPLKATIQLNLPHKEPSHLKCSECNITFRWQSTLEAHIKAFHTVQSSTATAKECPILAAELGRPSTTEVKVDLVPSKSIEVVTLDNEVKVRSETKRKSSVHSIPALVPLPSSTSSSGSTNPVSVVTICPYCFNTVLFNDFTAHVELHANKNAGAQKFSCPYSVCQEAYNNLPDLISHHKGRHQRDNLGRPKSAASNCTVLPAATVQAPIPEPASVNSVPTSGGEEIIGYSCSSCKGVKFPTIKLLLGHCRAHLSSAPSLQATSCTISSAKFSRGSLTVTPVMTTAPNKASHAATVAPMDPLALSDGQDGVTTMTQILGVSLASSLTVTPLPQPLTVPFMNTQNSVEHQSKIGVHPLTMTPLLKCPVCQVDGFLGEPELSMHILSHSVTLTQASTPISMPPHYPEPGKPYLCAPCNTSYTTLTERNLHYVNFHHLLPANMPAECFICKKIIKNARILARHIKLVHKEHLYCLACPAMFTNEQLYNQHMELHSPSALGVGLDGNQRFRCLECLQIFNAPGHLFDHYRRFHNKGDKCTCVTCNILVQRKNLPKHLELHQRANSDAAGSSNMAFVKPDAFTSPAYSQSFQLTTPQPPEFAIMAVDPLAAPGEEANTVVYQPTFDQAQFEFEDVTIGFGEESHNWFEMPH